MIIQPSSLLFCSWASILFLSQSVSAFLPASVPRFSTTQMAATTNGDSTQKFPKLIVLDLDNTLWTPELYQLRKLQRTNQYPVAGKDVQLMKGSVHLLEKIRAGDYGSTKFAVASRTKSVDWAHDLLDQFEIRELMDYVEIFPGDKKQHFENLARDSGIAFDEMLFFDDNRDGKYGNCEPVSAMGVLSVHCPTGLDQFSVWEDALQRYHEWDKKPNTIVEWDGSVTSPGTISENLQEGTIKTINAEKRFGFITPAGARGRRSDVFFHFSALPDGMAVEQGDKLQYTIQKDPRNGKFRAANIQLADNGTPANTIPMRAFSMNMPFAALLANGYKTLESRNGTMFTSYPEGTQMLLHVGRRNYPDGNKHMEILRDDNLSDEQIQDLKSLPPSFDKGMLVAVMTIGKTYDTTTAERSTPERQRNICAYGSDSGRRLTEIVKVSYLKKPVPMAAQGGVFKVHVNPDALPDDWELAPGIRQPDAYRVDPSSNLKQQQSNDNTAGSAGKSQSNTKKSPVYSISG